ncbi:aminopeptidase [Raphidocelis subcapitata]|uniref:Aminopeptidase n=1 Tax=Raphidocelis subcapitata TaxID=307507 RepID=A0A2V0NN52_9CHLO|nr:aminopeptidase [Raphidocelis subcapitata]|eukprot:GBF88981.1 aminopeptidase [Raphidocelis subcapitata]
MSNQRDAAGGGRVNTLVMPPEKHISVPKEELRLALKNRLELSDRGHFDDLVKLMEGVASFDFVDLKHRMRSNFLPFGSGARNKAYLAGLGRELTPEDLDDKELEFLCDTYDVLRASHYHLLTRDEWRIAQSESFQLNLPLEVEWGYMDGAMTKRFWAAPGKRELRDRLPDEVADHILVFHRGVGTARLKGLLIEEKLDLLTEYTVMRVLDKIIALLPSFVWRRPAAAPAPGAGRRSGGGRAASAASGRDAPSRCDSALGGEMQGETYVASNHKYAKAVERVTLKRLCPTVLTLLKAFPKTLELQEPTFRDVVVVYRRAIHDKKDQKPAGEEAEQSQEERVQHLLNARNIYIKVFGETPMADVEIIFPSKRVHVKPFQLINLLITTVTALVTGALMLARAGKELSVNALWTAASLVLTRCFQVYSQAQTQKSQMQHDMCATLYDKMQDSQEGVVTAIMEEMADQQFKQMLLAYMLLLLKDRALKEDELDSLCEEFLVRDFEHRIDFQVQDSLPRLERWGLVARTDQGKIAALSMPQAIDVLAASWSVAYKALGSGNDAAGIPTADLLSGRASRFGSGTDAFSRSLLDPDAAARRGVFAKAKGKLANTFKSGFGGRGSFTGRGSGGGGADVAAAAAAATAGSDYASALTPTPEDEGAEVSSRAAAAAAAARRGAPSPAPAESVGEAGSSVSGGGGQEESRRPPSGLYQRKSNRVA